MSVRPRRSFCGWRAFLILAPALVLLQGTAQAAPVTGRVAERTGVVPDGVVTITGTHLPSGRQFATVAGPDGSFRFADIPEGRLVVVVTSEQTGNEPIHTQVLKVPKEGISNVTLPVENPVGATFDFLLYKGEFYNNKPTYELADEVFVDEGASVSNINMALAEGGGTISGRVTNAAGTEGIPGFLVFAIAFESSVISFDRTDANGNYTITGIPADSFLVSANIFIFGNWDDTDWIGEYYNDATILDADPVAVTEGNDTPDIDFRLEEGGTLTGRITADQGGAGIPNAEVSAFMPPPAFFGYSVVTDEDGFYTMRGLPASNEYQVAVEAEGYIEEDFPTPVTITSGETTSGINLALATGGTITGSVRRDGTNEPLEDMNVLAMDIVTEDSWFTFTDENGDYEITGLPSGTYHVSVAEIGEWYDNATSEEEADHVDVNAGFVTSGINFVGTPIVFGCDQDPSEVGTITGQVTRTTGGAVVPEAEVWVWMDLGPFGRLRLYSAEADANGNYTIDCLEPNTYYVQATAPGTNLISEWWNDADSLTADPVDVEAGETVANTNFALDTGGSIAGRVTIEGTSTPLALVFVTARNVQTGEEFFAVTDDDGDYVLSEGDEGGMREGDYKVQAWPKSTADLSLIPVILSRFEAFEVNEGIAVEWTVEGDEVLSGFHVYRDVASTGQPLRLTEMMLPGDAVRFVDTSAPEGDASYWIGIIDRDGREERFGPVSARRGSAPVLTQLLGPRPNPMRQSSSIAYTLARTGHVSVRIHDLSGRLVRTLVDEERPAGAWEVNWDARRDDGQPVRRGMYYVRFVSDGVEETEKLVLTR